jgi:hypothetical protein
MKSVVCKKVFDTPNEVINLFRDPDFILMENSAYKNQISYFAPFYLKICLKEFNDWFPAASALVQKIQRVIRISLFGLSIGRP